MPLSRGNQGGARSTVGTGNFCGLTIRGQGEEDCQGFPGCRGRRKESWGTDFGVPVQCWEDFLIRASRRALRVSGEAPGTAQTPPEPGVPAPHPLSPCDPHAPGEAQGRVQAPARGLSPACHFHAITSWDRSPVPLRHCCFQRGTHLPSSSLPLTRLPRGCRSVPLERPFPPSAGASGSFLWDVACPCALFRGHLPLPRLRWLLPLSPP